ncbi:YlbL family protein [Glutamicibacter halophytocola]|uniref:endopeptidase La n=1 Tax=Glutamicibacter halophytocola TaxID=1933880 RepID=A0AA94XQ68_9MICC|nr:S16 family serine protease [Glutamicibacter halophytocola]UUX57810.1 signal protein PDZ [Glutamicibacter halophytocola]
MHEREPQDSMKVVGEFGRAPQGSKAIKRTSAGVLALLLIGVMLFLPTNFMIRSPGPVFNTLGKDEDNGKDVISIEGDKTYPSQSELDLLTIYVQGGGQNRVTIPVVLEALLNPAKDVVPEETIISRNTSTQQQNEQNDQMMTSSQDLAIAAALTELGYDFKTWLTVADFSSDANSKSLEKGDRLLKYNGKEIVSLDELKKSLNANGEKPAELTVGRKDKQGNYKEVVVPVTTGEADGERQLGIYLSTEHKFPIDVQFGLQNVGGPSAGMMFALGIIDRLTEGSLAGNHHVAGTGEISAEGNVGPIGGIAQKMVAAKNAGATIFLAPADNCNEVVGRIPEGLNVLKISTLSQARTALTKIADGESPADFSTCE